jgi:hypothetical protein
MSGSAATGSDEVQSQTTPQTPPDSAANYDPHRAATSTIAGPSRTSQTKSAVATAPARAARKAAGAVQPPITGGAKPATTGSAACTEVIASYLGHGPATARQQRPAAAGR